MSKLQDFIEHPDPEIERAAREAFEGAMADVRREDAERIAALEDALEAALKMIDHRGCPNDCDDGAIAVPLGENFVTREMAIDGGDPSLEGQSMGIEWGAEQCQWCDEREKIGQALDPTTPAPSGAKESDDE